MKEPIISKLDEVIRRALEMKENGRVLAAVKLMAKSGISQNAIERILFEPKNIKVGDKS